MMEAEFVYAYMAVFIGALVALPTIFRLFVSLGQFLVVNFYPYTSVTFVVEEDGREVRKSVKMNNDEELVKVIMKAKRVCSK